MTTIATTCCSDVNDSQQASCDIRPTVDKSTCTTTTTTSGIVMFDLSCNRYYKRRGRLWNKHELFYSTKEMKEMRSNATSIAESLEQELLDDELNNTYTSNTNEIIDESSHQQRQELLAKLRGYEGIALQTYRQKSDRRKYAREVVFTEQDKQRNLENENGSSDISNLHRLAELYRKATVECIDRAYAVAKYDAKEAAIIFGEEEQAQLCIQNVAQQDGRTVDEEDEKSSQSPKLQTVSMDMLIIRSSSTPPPPPPPASSCANLDRRSSSSDTVETYKKSDSSSCSSSSSSSAGAAGAAADSFRFSSESSFDDFTSSTDEVDDDDDDDDTSLMVEQAPVASKISNNATKSLRRKVVSKFGRFMLRNTTK